MRRGLKLLNILKINPSEDLLLSNMRKLEWLRMRC